MNNNNNMPPPPPLPPDGQAQGHVEYHSTYQTGQRHSSGAFRYPPQPMNNNGNPPPPPPINQQPNNQQQLPPEFFQFPDINNLMQTQAYPMQVENNDGVPGHYNEQGVFIPKPVSGSYINQSGNFVADTAPVSNHSQIQGSHHSQIQPSHHSQIQPSHHSQIQPSHHSQIQPSQHSQIYQPSNHSQIYQPSNHSQIMQPSNQSQIYQPSNHSQMNQLYAPSNHSQFDQQQPSNHSQIIQPSHHSQIYQQPPPSQSGVHQMSAVQTALHKPIKVCGNGYCGASCSSGGGSKYKKSKNCYCPCKYPRMTDNPWNSMPACIDPKTKCCKRDQLCVFYDPTTDTYLKICDENECCNPPPPPPEPIEPEEYYDEPPPPPPPGAGGFQENGQLTGVVMVKSIQAFGQFNTAQSQSGIPNILSAVTSAVPEMASTAPILPVEVSHHEVQPSRSAVASYQSNIQPSRSAMANYQSNIQPSRSAMANYQSNIQPSRSAVASYSNVQPSRSAVASHHSVAQPSRSALSYHSSAQPSRSTVQPSRSAVGSYHSNIQPSGSAAGPSGSYHYQSTESQPDPEVAIQSFHNPDAHLSGNDLLTPSTVLSDNGTDYSAFDNIQG